jgi:hypothetical protein
MDWICRAQNRELRSQIEQDFVTDFIFSRKTRLRALCLLGELFSSSLECVTMIYRLLL